MFCVPVGFIGLKDEALGDDSCCSWVEHDRVVATSGDRHKHAIFAMTDAETSVAIDRERAERLRLGRRVVVTILGLVQCDRALNRLL